MASFRRKYQVESKDGPPVTTVPVAGAEPPPPVVDAKPPEPPAAEPSPADEAAKTALRQRLQEMENAEALQREAAVAQQHPQLAIEPQEPQMPTAEQIIEGSGLPENAKDWLRAHSEYVTDPILNAEMQRKHYVAEHQAGSEFTERYFDRMEILLGLKQEAQPSSNGQSAPSAPRNSAPPRRAPAGPPVSAPPTREVPSFRTGKPARPMQLTAEQREAARFAGVSEEEYQRQAEKLERLRASGVIQDGR